MIGRRKLGLRRFSRQITKDDGPRLPSFPIGQQAMQSSGFNKSKVGMAAGLRLVGFVCLALVAVFFFDTGPVLVHLAAVSGSALAFMIGLHVVIILLVSWRFAILARAAGAHIHIVEANRLTFGSTLANMVLPTSLAGDAGRVWLVQRFGLTLKTAMGVGVFDRIVGLGSLGAIVLMGALAEPSVVPRWTAALVCLVSFAAVIAFFARWKPPDTASAPRRSLAWRREGIFASTIALSLAAHLVSIAIAFLFLNDQGVSVGIGHLLVLFPAVLLAASVPVSIGGWGTRELAAAGAFAVIGLDGSMAIAMAFMFGVTQTLAAGLGTLCFALSNAVPSTEVD